MAKNVVIVVLFILLMLSVSYGYQQRKRADHQEMLATENANLARKAMEKAASVNEVRSDAAVEEVSQGTSYTK